jgi:hypothetical protein
LRPERLEVVLLREFNRAWRTSRCARQHNVPGPPRRVLICRVIEASFAQSR